MKQCRKSIGHRGDLEVGLGIGAGRLARRLLVGCVVAHPPRRRQERRFILGGNTEPSADLFDDAGCEIARWGG